MTNSYVFPSIRNLGRNEVDLMPLRIRAPSLIDPNVPNMTLKVSGGARIWLTPFKGIQLPLDAQGEATIPADVGEGLTLWVEAPRSESLRDISVKLKYLAAEDTVRATGVWADVTAVVTSTLPAFAVLSALPALNSEYKHALVKDQLSKFGGTGLRDITNEHDGCQWPTRRQFRCNAQDVDSELVNRVSINSWVDTRGRPGR